MCELKIGWNYFNVNFYALLTPLVTSSGRNSVPSGSARFSLPAWYCTTVPVCRAHSCERRRFSTATSIIKHGGSCHSAMEALDDNWWWCVSSRGGTSLEQFTTYCLVLFIAASIQTDILKTELFTRSYLAARTLPLVPCRWILSKHKSRRTCAHHLIWLCHVTLKFLGTICLVDVARLWWWWWW